MKQRWKKTHTWKFNYISNLWKEFNLKTMLLDSFVTFLLLAMAADAVVVLRFRNKIIVRGGFRRHNVRNVQNFLHWRRNVHGRKLLLQLYGWLIDWQFGIHWVDRLIAWLVDWLGSRIWRQGEWWTRAGRWVRSGPRAGDRGRRPRFGAGCDEFLFEADELSAEPVILGVLIADVQGEGREVAIECREDGL